MTIRSHLSVLKLVPHQGFSPDQLLVDLITMSPLKTGHPNRLKTTKSVSFIFFVVVDIVNSSVKDNAFSVVACLALMCLIIKP